MSPTSNGLRAHYHFWILLLVLLVQRAVILVDFNLQYTDTDQTLAWLIATDYSEGNFYQPFMYGQDYGYMVESLLAVPLLWCKVPVECALPIVTHLLALAPFVSFAFWFKKNGKYAAALLLLSVPLLLPLSYDLITSMPRGFINGLALFTFWPWIEAIRLPAVRACLYGLLCAAALCINPNVIFVVVLVGGMVLMRSEKKIAFALWFFAGTLLPLFLHLLAKSWATDNQQALIHHAWKLAWSSKCFTDAWGHPAAYFRGMFPFTETYAHVMLFSFLLLGLYALFKKQFVHALLLLLIFAGVIVSLGINKVSDGIFCVFFPLSRMFLGLPLVLALALAMLLGEIKSGSFALLLLGACVVSTIFKNHSSDSVIAAEVNTQEWNPVYIASVDALRTSTADVAAYCRTDSLQYIGGAGHPASFGTQQCLFHAGESWFDDFPHGAIPEYERRAWRLQEVMNATTDRTLWLGGVDWPRVDTVVGEVTVVWLSGLEFHRVDSKAGNQKVFSALGK